MSYGDIDADAATRLGLLPLVNDGFLAKVRLPEPADIRALGSAGAGNLDARVLLSGVQAVAAHAPFAGIAVSFFVFVVTQAIDSAGAPDLAVLILRTLSTVAVGLLLVRFGHNVLAARRWQTLLEHLA
ncbi:hypothetical protein [Demequina soli]|uniref:hypothetical protein n=1 Tax=Demequina soli TaxID=1638987 RepID=UPI0012E00B72|nr:hypothetical protein [Demequina soli]